LFDGDVMMVMMMMVMMVMMVMMMVMMVMTVAKTMVMMVMTVAKTPFFSHGQGPRRGWSWPTCCEVLGVLVLGECWEGGQRQRQTGSLYYISHSLTHIYAH
jgi:hypothetical protein